MLKALSTRRAPALVLTVSCVPALACVDAKGRFDEYDQRLPHIDASNIDSPVVDMIPNIDGEWLLASVPATLGGDPVQLRITWNITSSGATGTLDGSYQPLKTFGIPRNDPGRVPVGAAIVANGVAVDNTASFRARVMGTLPGDANPVSGSEFPLDVTLVGTIQSMDVVCGMLEGTVGPLNVTGSRWGTVRIPNGQPLPAPVVDCPGGGPVDAGVDAP